MKNRKLSFAKPLICLITKGEATRQNFSEKSIEILNLIKIAVENKIPLIQIREKELPARLVYDLTTKAVKIARNSPTSILVNDRADVALTAEADGVHLTSNSLSTEIVRQNFPPDFVVGVSAHSLVEVIAAKRQGADFAAFSPVFYSPEKGEPKGLEELQKICSKAGSFPIIALSGINETNYKSVLTAGAAGFAAIRFLNNPKNLRKLK